MSASSYSDLVKHVGHEIECATYADENVALECLTCSEVLVDFTDEEATS